METLRVSDYIAIDPDICHGKPCFKGTRVMVATVLELMEAGQSSEELLKGFPQLDARHVKAALHFAAQAVDSGKFAPAG